MNAYEFRAYSVLDMRTKHFAHQCVSYRAIMKYLSVQVSY